MARRVHVVLELEEAIGVYPSVEALAEVTNNGPPGEGDPHTAALHLALVAALKRAGVTWPAR